MTDRPPAPSIEPGRIVAAGGIPLPRGASEAASEAAIPTMAAATRGSAEDESERRAVVR